MFVNRVSELELLEKRYASGKAEFFVLYGRRRVGKTELLARFCEGKRSIFFVSDLGSEISLRTALSAAVNSTLFGPNQMNAVYSTWEDLFHALAQAAHVAGVEGVDAVAVVDQFIVHAPILQGAQAARRCSCSATRCPRWAAVSRSLCSIASEPWSAFACAIAPR